MRRLFGDDGSYTEECCKIEGEIAQAIEAVFAKYTDVDMRDLQLSALSAATDASLSMVIDRRKSKKDD